MANLKTQKGKKSKSKQKSDIDDTPRSFKRVMELQARMSNPRPPKKQAPKTEKDGDNSAETPKLVRKRGESMAEFSRRVDQAIPLPKARGVDSRKTLKNAKKHKAKAENLREEYKQRLDAKRRRQEEEDMNNDDLTVEDDGEDVWAKVNAKAKQPKFGEIADRPPELPKLKTKSSIPKSAGSLARRQMLEEERERFIEQYRKLRGNDVQVNEQA